MEHELVAELVVVAVMPPVEFTVLLVVVTVQEVPVETTALVSVAGATTVVAAGVTVTLTGMLTAPPLVASPEETVTVEEYVAGGSPEVLADKMRFAGVVFWLRVAVSQLPPVTGVTETVRGRPAGEEKNGIWPQGGPGTVGPGTLGMRMTGPGKHGPPGVQIIL